jgi:GNAT superfamily N-acetyltransferase
VSAECRAIRGDEIPEAVEVFLLGLADMLKRNGLAFPPSFTQASIEPLYRHIFETGIFEVVERDGRIAVICNAIVRDDIGFLCMFWARPELRLHGLGRPLLERVLTEARRRGARVLCTWSSIDFAAMGMYLKLGMLPGGPIFTFSGKPRSASRAPGEFSLQPLQSATASRIDAELRGTPRSEDHAYWQARGVPGFQVEVAGEPIAYFYVQQGVIGPAGWLHAKQGADVLACALEVAGAQASEVKLMTLGGNTTAVRAATEAGLRLVGSAHWLRSQNFGALDQYLPSGPGLF